MVLRKVKNIGKKLDWFKTSNKVFGLHKGYFFNLGETGLFDENHFKYIISSTYNFSNEQKELVLKELEANKDNLKYTEIEVNESSIVINFLEIFKTTKAETIYSLLDFLVVIFKKYDISEQNNCHSSNSKENLNFYNLNETGIILSNNSFISKQKDFYNIERKKYAEEKNYFIGFLGSVFFSIPIIILWVICAAYFQVLSSGMSVMIGILGIKGYVFFKGKNGVLTNYIIVLSNIICVLLANFFTVFYLLYNAETGFNEIINQFQEIEEIKMYLFNGILISLILSIIVWIWLFFIHKESKNIIQIAKKI